MRAEGRRQSRLRVAVSDLLADCPHCGQVPPARLVLEVGYGPELRWLVRLAVRQVRRIATAYGYEVETVRYGDPSEEIALDAHPRARFATLVLRRTTPGHDATRDPTPSLTYYRRLLETYITRTHFCRWSVPS